MIRCCVVCRKTAEKQELLRFVLQCVSEMKMGRGSEVEERVVVLDVGRCLPGRGAYCHSAACCVGAPKVEALLVASLVRAAKQQGNAVSAKLRGVDVVVEEALRHSALGVAVKQSLQRIFDEVRVASESKRMGKPGRVRL